MWSLAQYRALSTLHAAKTFIITPMMNLYSAVLYYCCCSRWIQHDHIKQKLLYWVLLVKRCNWQRHGTYIFAERPVIGSIGERMHGPLLQQTAGDHIDLDLLQDLPQDLVTGLGPPGLNGCQALIVTGDRGVRLQATLGTALEFKTESNSHQY